MCERTMRHTHPRARCTRTFVSISLGPCDGHKLTLQSIIELHDILCVMHRGGSPHRMLYGKL